MDWFHLTSDGWTRVPDFLKSRYEDTGKTDRFLSRENGFYKLDPKGVVGKIVERKEK